MMRKYILFIYVAQLLASSSAFAQMDKARLESVQRELNRVQNELDFSPHVAQLFLINFERFLDQVKLDIARVANNGLRSTERREAATRLLSMHFITDAVVQVSSTKDTSMVYSFDAEEYFDRLQKVEILHHYSKTELIFDPRVVKIGEISRLDDNTVEMNVLTKQYFRGCRPDRYIPCYIDLTFKNFRVEGKYDDIKGEFKFRVVSITVSATITQEEERYLSEVKGINMFYATRDDLTR